MVRQISPEVWNAIEQKMASGNYASENELLLDALQALDAEQSDLAAIQEAMDEYERGERGIPVHEAFAKLLSQYDKAD